MLALKSYEQTNGFSVMDADELFFINGGSETCSNAGNTSPFIPTSNGWDPTPQTQDQKNKSNLDKTRKGRN